jgi:hypothetical protein
MPIVTKAVTGYRNGTGAGAGGTDGPFAMRAVVRDGLQAFPWLCRFAFVGAMQNCTKVCHTAPCICVSLSAHIELKNGFKNTQN